MKKTKRFLALMTAGFLAITPMAATGLTAVAATITVNKVSGDNVTHSYKAYPIITGTLASDGVTLTGLSWGSGVSLSDLATALAAFDTAHSTGYFSTFTASSTPDDFAAMLDNVPEALYEDLAKVFNTSGVVVTSSGTQLTNNSGGTGYEATGLADGWYLVKDETSSLTGSARSANILAVKGSAAITPKYSLPTLEKKIVDNGLVDANTAAIGDIVSYQITTAVPDMTGYDKYFFIVEDNLSAGLSYNGSSLSVKYGSGEGTAFVLDSDGPTDDTETGDYYVTVSGGSIKIVFENFRNNMLTKSISAGTPITITYNATLNSNASIDPGTGNPNSAKLVYSNDPNVDNTGIVDDNPDTPNYPDEPKPDNGSGDGDVVGETPWDKVNTYTTAIKIKKVDQDGNPLKGATFTLQGTNLNKVMSVSGSTFQADPDGTYWKLTNGSYTTTSPTGLTTEQLAKYEDTATKYKKVTATPTEQTASGSTLAVSATVDDDGYLTFSGLNAGVYTLVESGVPSGYNKADDITFTLAANTKDENTATWTNDSNKFDTMDADDMFPTTIVNRKGAILPSTGGIGTKLFYIFGSILVAGSVIFLVTKKRMSAKEN